jgi:Transketolase, pyrimidine binding domain
MERQCLPICPSSRLCPAKDVFSNSYKVTKGLLDRFGPKRVIDSPITESGFAGLTVGAALAGLHPVVGQPVSLKPIGADSASANL